MVPENDPLDLLSADPIDIKQVKKNFMIEEPIIQQPQDNPIPASTGEDDDEPYNEELVTAIQSYIEQVISAQ